MRCRKVFVVRLLLLVLVMGLIGTAIYSQHNTGYIGNTRTYVFHRETCHHLPAMKNRTYFNSRKEAINANYRLCRKCRP